MDKEAKLRSGEWTSATIWSFIFLHAPFQGIFNAQHIYCIVFSRTNENRR